MKRTIRRCTLFSALVAAGLAVYSVRPMLAIPRRHKPKQTVSANDPTARLYQILDQSADGKAELYLIADLYTDPSNPSHQYQRILRAVYNKSLYFGRFTIHVRSVAKMSPQQVATYTPEQIFNYASSDTSVFEKINPGPFGKTGDLYLVATTDHPLASAPISQDVRQEYDKLVTDYILPAVEKQTAAKQ